jgi:ATP-dependent DNA helicase DinG
MEAAGPSAFRKVMLPRMVIRLKQGVGRLLRTTEDRGVVIILDRRLVEKEYSREVLHSLPPAPIEVVESEAIPARVGEWFGEETIRRWQGKSKPEMTKPQ